MWGVDTHPTLTTPQTLPGAWEMLWRAGEEHFKIAEGLLHDAQGRNKRGEGQGW